jgi:hypothetical protein
MICVTVQLDDEPGILENEIDAVSPVPFSVSEPMLALDQASQVAELS